MTVMNSIALVLGYSVLSFLALNAGLVACIILLESWYKLLNGRS